MMILEPIVLSFTFNNHGWIFLNSFAKPITPQASLDPELPVFRDYSLFPRPKSS
jgi:hypothetical protein